MPRHLTNRQKKYIDELIAKGLTDIDQMGGIQFQHLESMNDFETLYQCTNMYIWDKRMEGACDHTLKSRSTL